MAMSTIKGAASPPPPREKPKWIFSKEEMKNTASQKDGMSKEEELTYRQMAAAFIQEMIDGLNMVKDVKLKIGHTGVCVAHTHMHRFYYWHSFKKFDYRDVAAACVFVAGKSHECPRKLSHVVSVWRDKKDRRQLTTEAAKNEASQIIVLLESMILQTISFDLNIALPHATVLEIMRKVDKDSDDIYRSLTSCAYYFATDVIAVTDWFLRYSAQSIACAVIHLMAAYANLPIEKLFAESVKDGPWYKPFDDTMTDEKLKEMEIDFIQTYKATCHLHHATKYNMRQPTMENHPDVKKIDRTRDARSHSPMVQVHYPDSSTMNGRPRGYVPKDELTVERLNKERVIEEERRKRDHDRMTGRIDNSTSSEKRARIDPLSNNFVTSSTSSSNGKLPPPPVPPNLNFPPPPVFNNSIPPPGYGRGAGGANRHPSQQSSSVSPAFRPSFSARAFDVAPMLTPPSAPLKRHPQSADSSDMDLEDGEVE